MNTLNFLDETGLLTVWDIIKLYFRNQAELLASKVHYHTKNDITNLKNIDDSTRNDGGLMSLECYNRLSDIVSTSIVEGISVNNETVFANDDNIININVPTKISDLENDSDFLINIEDILTIREGAAAGATAVQPSDLSDVATTGDYTDLINVPLNLSDFNNDVGYLTLHQDISGKADKSAAIGSLSLAINSTNFLITLSGTKVDGTSFTVQDVIDLPLESVVVNGSYDDTTKKVILTLQNGSVIDFSVADLVAGLQSEINSSNKLPSDLVDDTNCINKFVTTLEKSQWNSKYDKPSGGISKSDLESSVQTSLGKADTALQGEVDPIFNASPASEITSLDIVNWNSKYDKPSNGIPKTDLALSVLDSLSAADSAYLKPNTGIPKSDLAQGVKDSLDLADTAIQTETDPIFSASPAAGITNNDITNWNNKTSNTGTITSVKMNGTTIATSGEADLGTVITDVSDKANKNEMSISTNGDQTTITLKNGTSATVINTHLSLSNYILKSQTSGLIKNDGTVDTNTYLTTELDPVFAASPAANINSQDLSKWDVAYNLSHIHNNKSVLDGISSSDITNWNNKYTKPSGGIPASDLTSAVLSLLTAAGTALQPADITTLTNKVTALEDLVATDSDAVIDKFNEIVTFLNGINATDTLSGLLSDISTQIAAKYTKPSTGIPKSDLANDVQTSLGKADTALLAETDPTVPSCVKNINLNDITDWNNKLNKLIVGNNLILSLVVNSDYQVLECIETTGTLYIDTGIKGNMSYTYEIDFQLTLSSNYRIWGVYGQAQYTGYSMCLTFSTGFMVRWESDSAKARGVDLIQSLDTNRHLIRIENGHIYWDNIDKGTSLGHLDNFSINYNLFLGTINPADNTPTYISKAKFYSYSVWDTNNILILKLIPAKKISTGEIGMYDIVSNTFLQNAGSGNLKENFLNTEGGTYLQIGGGSSNLFIKGDGSLDSRTFLTAHQDISGKADKVSNATNGNFAGLDANGNLTDSGKKASDFATAAQGALANTALQSISAGDNVVVSGNEVSVPTFPVNKIVPMYEKTYENYTCSAASDNDKIIYFGNVIPTSSNYYDSWEIYYTLDVHTSNDYCQGQYDVRISLGGSNLVYAVYNRFGSDSYLPIYYHLTLRYNSTALYANRETYPVKIGMRILSAYLPTSLARTYTIKVWDVRNCTFSFNNTFETHANIYSNTNYGAVTTLSATSRGLQETGDLNDTGHTYLTYTKLKAGTNGIKLYSLIMQDDDGNWLSFTTGAGGTGTTKAKNPAGFKLGSRVYYVSRSSDLAAGNYLGTSEVKTYSLLIDLRRTLNINTTANGLPGNLMPYLPVYIVGHLGNDGLFYLEDTWWTQYEPTTEDGKIYIRVAEAVYNDYENARCYRADLLSDGYAYWYKDGAFRRFYGKESLNSYSISDLEFVYRKTADEITLYNGNKAAINSIKGSTLAWNQLLPSINTTNYTSATRLNITDGVISYNGSSGNYWSWSPLHSDYRINYSTKNHIFYISCNVLTNTTEAGSFTVGGSAANVLGGRVNFNGETGYKSAIINNNTDYTLQGITLQSSTSHIMTSEDSLSIADIILIDLTLIYGSGNEPSTPEQFEADYFRWFGKPLSYEPYDAGSLRNVQMQGIKTIGFNQWDEEWEVGTINNDGTETTTANGVKSSNFCKCLPQTFYYVTYPSGTTNVLYICWYDSNKTYIKRDSITRGGEAITSPLNASYFKISIGGYGEYDDKFCINISDTNKNGTYEPYEEHNVSVPVTTLTGKVNGEGESVVIFPDGMKGVGDIKDEIRVENGVTKAIKRIGRVDLGSLDFTRVSQTNRDIYHTPLNAAKPTSYTSNANLLCANFISVSQNTTYVPGNMVVPYTSGVVPLGSLGLFTAVNAYTDAATFKTAMSGVYLDYELAEPIEYVVDDFVLPVSYTVSKEGTEEIIPVTGEITVAPTLNITYGVNVLDIKGLPKVSSSDNGKTLLVVNGLWALVSVPTIYTGTGVPDDLDGNDGDIYIQTF